MACASAKAPSPEPVPLERAAETAQSTSKTPAKAPAKGLRVEVDQTQFRVTLPDGHTLSQEEIVGMKLTVKDDAGASRKIRIDAFKQDPKDPSGEITLYDVSVQDPNSGEWGQFCNKGPDGLAAAFPLAGVWTPDGRHLPSTTQFNMTCTSGAIGKCVRFGYKPWKKGPNGAPLWDHHVACTRMVRGDYCGDGTAFTKDGMLINIHDPLGIQTLDPDPTLVFEAGWSESGALCVHHVRVEENTTLAALEAKCPERLAGHTGNACSKAAVMKDPALRLLNHSKPRGD